MKIYIVTQGCYSDYGIKKVFTDKAKAELYAKLKTTSGWDGDCRVEEYDTADDFMPENIYYNLECLIKIKKNTNGYTAYSPETTVYENDTTKSEHTYFWKESNGRKVSECEFELVVYRTYDSKNISKDQAITKVEKVAEDISTQICYEMNCNGATFEDIESSMYDRPENKMEEF